MEHTYINIQSWMISDLDLKGNELLIYAIIYGFCQDKESRFRGGRSYLATWTNSTVRGVQKNINSLIEKGFIEKEEKVVGGKKFCTYYPINLPWENNVRSEEESSSETGNKVPTCREQSSYVEGTKFPPGVNKVPSGGEQSSPNNIKNNIKDNIESSSSADEPNLPFSPQNSYTVAETVKDRWNSLQAFGIKPVSRITHTSTRYKMLQARIREHGMGNVLCAIDRIRDSGFLRGNNYSGWMITFDWFIKPNNFLKVLEGNYDDKGKDGAGHEDSGRKTGGCVRDGSQKPGYDASDYFGPLLDT